MKEDPTTHPDAQTLAAFQARRLHPSEADAVERHLAGCADCRARAAREAPTVVPAAPTSFSLVAPSPTRGVDGRTAPGAAVLGDQVPPGLLDHPRYRVLQLLGSGGMGSVYKAEHRLMERTVALKVINPALVGNADAVTRFRLEVRAAARLAHPNIVVAYDAEQVGDLHLLVMEYVEGKTLADVVAWKGRLPVAHACEFCRQAALGLQHAHEKGMVHRDVKPQNLILAPGNLVKILDFGLARFVSEAARDGRVTAAGGILGTPDYIAPEQALDPRRADIRADIYSLGCTLYFLLAGRAPFAEGTALQKIMDHVERAPEPVAAFRDDLPDGLAEVVARMTAKEPGQRFQTPEEVARELARLVRGATAPPSERVAAPAAPAPAARREGRGPSAATPVARERGARAPRGRPRGDPRPAARWKAVVAVAAVLLASLIAFGGYRAATNKGQLVVTAPEPEIELAVLQGGRPVAVVSGLAGGAVDLQPGEYELRLVRADPGLRLATDRFALGRGDRVVAEVVRNPPAAATPPAAAAPVPPPAAATLPPREAPPVAPAGPTARAAEAARPPAPEKPRAALGEGELLCMEGHHGAVRRVTFCPDGRHALSCSYDGTLRLWDLDVGQPVRVFIGTENKAVSAMGLWRDGSRVISAGADNTLRVWDVADGRELQRFAAFGSKFPAVALAPDDLRFVCSDAADGLVLFSLENGQEVGRLGAHAGLVSGVAFSRDGRLVLSGGYDRTVRVWEVSTGRERGRFGRHRGSVTSVALSPDGRWALSGDRDHTARLWEVAGGKQLQCLVHPHVVWDVALSPDGRRALTGCSDGLRLWDLRSGNELKTFSVPSGQTLAVAFSPDGRRGLSAGTDGKVRLWGLPDDTAATGGAAPGRLVVDSAPADLVTTVRQRDAVVVDRTPQRTLELKPGEYEVRLSQAGRDLQQSAERVTLLPGGRVVVRAWEAELAWPADKLRAGGVAAPALKGEKVLLQAVLRGPKDLNLLKKKFPDGAEFGFARGRYFMHLPAGVRRGDATTNRWDRDNFAYELVGRVVKPEGAGWGVGLWHQESGQGMIGVALAGTGTVQVVSTSQNRFGPGCPRGPVAHPAIKPWREANTLLVVFKRPFLEVYVNGVAVLDPLLVDRDFKPGDMNLGAFAEKEGADVEFLRVAASTAEGLPAPQARGAVPVR